MFRHTKKSRRSAEARALKLRLESLEERQLLTAVGWEAVATNEQVCYGPEFRASAERCEATIDLLATTGVDFAAEEYAAIRAAYPALGLKENFADVNVIEIDSTNIGVVALKKAIEVARTTDKDDLIVVRTTEVANTIEYSTAEDQIVFNIDSSAYGAVNIVALGTQPLTINAYGSSGVINIEVGNVGLANLFITGGFATEGYGGGVYVGSESVLVATNSTISGNEAYVDFGCDCNSYGGGVYVGEGATFTSTNSKIVYNEAFHMGEGDSYGGGVYVGKGATFTSTNSTIVGNKAYVSYEGDCYGGGVYVGEGATFTSTNSTIAGNLVYVELDGNGYGGGVENSGTFNATNTILCSNFGDDLDGDVSSDENNLIGADPSFVCAPEFSWDGYLLNANSLDLRLNFDSSAIDQGDDQSAYDAGLTVDSTDMVGESRFAGHAIDIGSYEYHVPLTSVVISGGVNVGETLSAKAYSESEEVESATYVWALDGNEISSDYVVSIFDVGRTLTVKATGTGDYAGTVEKSEEILSPSKVVIAPTPENLVRAIDVLLDGGTIKFTRGDDPQTIYVESPFLIGDKSLTIDGTGANVIFDGRNVAPVESAPLRTSGDDYDGEGTHRLFEVEGALNLTNVTIQNGSADYGGAIKNAGTLMLDGVTFQNNEATKSGGAIFNDVGATLTITDGYFSNNNAENGGVIANYGTMEIGGDYNKLQIEENTAGEYGGAIFNGENATLKISCGDFSNNNAENGGVIANYGMLEIGEDYDTLQIEWNTASEYGGAIFNGKNATLKISYGDFSNNRAYNGGAIANYGTLEISGDYNTLWIEENTASEYGGAIFNAATLDISGGIFSNNRAYYNGVIFNEKGATLTISGGDFSYNSADNGGVIFNEEGATLTISGGKFSNNRAYDGGVIANRGTMEISGDYDTLRIEENTASHNGGVIFNEEGATLTISGGNFLNNSAAHNGGAIFNDIDATLTISGGNFSNNRADENGGVIANRGTMKISGDYDTLRIEQNTANITGGAVSNEAGATLTISGGDFSNNRADNGGAVSNEDGATLTISGGDFSNNRADNGGVIFNAASLDISGGDFSNNSAENGGVIFNAAWLDISGGDFSNNRADNGGVVFNAAWLDISGGDFSKNRAENGGAIFNDFGATQAIVGGNFSKNNSTKNGGAIFNDFGATQAIVGGAFRKNSANNGGAFANYGITEISGETTISENSANRFGGAYFGCGELTVGGNTSFMLDGVGETSFELNVAGLKGGAIYNDVKKSDGENPIFGVVTINGDVSFVGNTAGERGGAIQTYSTFSIGGTATFSGNQANGEIYERYGGAIDVGEGGSATLSGSLTFDKNAADFGGAIFSVNNLTFDADGDYTFKENVADGSGGAIDALAGTLTLGGSFTFTSNKANGTYDDASEDCWDKTGLGGALAIATSAENTTVDGAKFVWSGNFAENGYGNCVAFKNDCGISAETFGLEDAADYVMFDELVENVNSLQSLLPRSISPNAVEATIMIEGVKTTFGAEGVTPQQLGLGVGTYEALVQYVDATGGTSASYVLKLTVVPGASVEVGETSIADGRGVKFDFNLTKADGGAVSVWEISWGDGSTTRSENLSESWLAAHYYAQDGTFDVSLKVVYLDGTSETFEAFSTQKIGASVAKTEALSAVFAHVDDLFEDAFVEIENLNVYGPAFLR